MTIDICLIYIDILRIKIRSVFNIYSLVVARGFYSFHANIVYVFHSYANPLLSLTERKRERNKNEERTPFPFLRFKAHTAAQITKQ